MDTPHIQIPTSEKRSVSETEIRELTDFLDVLMDAARETILPHFRTRVATDNKAGEAGYDPVTVADKGGEKAIRALIERHYPQHGILGEEFGYKEPSDGLTWIIDPIDGTRAFISGMPTWGVLIGLFDGEKCILGAMDQPHTGERFTGSALGSFIRRNGQSTQMRTSDTQLLSQSSIYSTTPEMFASGNELALYHKLADQCRLPRFGADCYAYAMLAHGMVDLVVESSLQPYDIAAHIPIIENAGGFVKDWQGGPAHNSAQVLAAANRSLLEQAIAILNQPT